MPAREKENAKEWKSGEEAGVQKGNVHTYVNQWIDEDHTSGSASEGPALSHPGRTITHVEAKSKPPPRNLSHIREVKSKKSPAKSRPRQAITFTSKRDNAAKVAYRNNLPPSTTFDMGRALVEIEPSVLRLQRTLEEIGVRFGSFLQVAKRARSDAKLWIWGNQKQVDDTIKELRQWRYARTRSIPNLSRPAAKENFAKITSSIGVIHAAEEKTAKRNAERQHYQQAPQPGQRFRSTGYFLWPNDEVRAIDLFGPNCEALDPLRIECKVHILFDEARSVFKIHSNKGTEHVNQVIQRIENTIREYVARDHRPATLLLVEPLDSAEKRNHVKTVDGPLVGVSCVPSKIPVLDGMKVENQDTAALKQVAEGLVLRNSNMAYTAAQKVLERIPYYRGHLRMRICFGTFTLVKFQWPPGTSSVTLDKFTTDVQSAGTKGALIRNIYTNRAPLDILDCCYNADELFQAIGTNDQSLIEVSPQYAAMFYLRHPEKSDEKLQLEIVFKSSDAYGEGFESSRAHWTRGGKPDTVTQAPPLDIFHIRLSSGVSWQLQLSAENVVDPSRITPRMEEFANGVQFREAPPAVYPVNSGYKVFTNPPNFPMIGMEQKTTLRYSLKAQPSCIFELSRYDEYNGDDPNYPSSTMWAASFYDRDWEVNLSENKALGIGQSASWNPDVRPFFQSVHGSTDKGPYTGFTDFLHHVGTVASFLDRVKGIAPESTVTEGGLEDSNTNVSVCGNHGIPDLRKTDNGTSEHIHGSYSKNEITSDQLDLFELTFTEQE
ncbi:MAG: hypothetical protein Q9197_000686 [Variospora fuerteventurae]